MSTPNEFMVMGYVSMSFGPDSAIKLFNKFVGNRDFRSAPAGIVRYQDLSYRATAHPDIVLDYHVDQKGTVVQQKMWQPLQTGDVHRHFRDAALCLPVFFIRTDHVIGVDMSHIHSAGAGAPLNIFNASAPAPLGGVGTTHFCVKWPGYTREFKKQAEIKDANRAPITMLKLVQRISRFVERFFEEAANWPIDPRAQYWRVGPHHITKDHVYIVGLVQVSASTWQPIIQLKGANFL